MNAPNVSHWILGLNFFHGYYTIFDAGYKRVGFARSIHSQGEDVYRLGEQEQFFSTQFRKNLLDRKSSLSRRNMLIYIPLGLIFGFIISCCTLKYCKEQKISDIRLRDDNEANASTIDRTQLLASPEDNADDGNTKSA